MPNVDTTHHKNMGKNHAEKTLDCSRAPGGDGNSPASDVPHSGSASYPLTDPRSGAEKSPDTIRQRGKFLVLEGGEGSGKSTQMQCMSRYLCLENIPHILTREPGGTPLGEHLRSAIVGEDLDSIEEILLILAARRHHIRMVIQPALDAGMWVLCDRFVDSSMVYQGLVGGLDLDFLRQWHVRSGCDLMPDLTFILQVDPVAALARRQENRLECNKFDQKGLEFHQKVYQAYTYIAEQNPDRCVPIPAGGDLDQVTAEILKHMRYILDC